MDTDSLREQTRAEHEAVEALMPLMNADLTREQYAVTLRCMYRAVRSWEEWAAVHAPSALATLAAERRRAHLIEADLQFLGFATPATEDANNLQAVLEPHGALPASLEATFLGAMYVVEGSTLGGQYIARHVEEQFGLEPGVGDAYFRGYGEQTGSRWRSFKELLQAVPDEHAGAAIAAAKAMFAYFGIILEPCALATAEAAHEA